MNSFGALSINERSLGIVERCNWRAVEVEKIDRRRRYTLSVIREAFFALLAEVGFAKMTVADICRRADINRGTFYLHYEDKFALLDTLIDEALAAVPPLEGSEADALCQRPPANDDYYLLFVHNVQGNLAVNRLLGWKRGPEFAHAQELLSAYSEGGMRAVSARHDFRS